MTTEARVAEHLAALRRSHIGALQRRAAQHGGEARRVLEARLQQLREADAPAATAAPEPAAATPLKGLLQHIALHSGGEGELKAVRDYRGTWVRLGVQQRITQTLAQVPSNAGPLNTQRLLHQALHLMSSTSPAYLQHFMAYAEGLLALEQVGAATPAPKKDATPRAGKPPAPAR